MCSRLYRYFLVLSLLVIWLGGPQVIRPEYRFLATTFLVLGLPVILWVDTLWILGLRSLRSVPAMLRIFGRSRRGNTLTAVTVVALLFWLYPGIKNPHPFRWLMSGILVATIAILWLQPPSALVLGQSNKATGRLLGSISSRLFPLRIVALLDWRRTGRHRGTFSHLTDCLRTDSDHDWRAVVDIVADMVPMIVLDTRSDSPVVSYEVGRIKSSPSRLARTFFVVEDDGRAPALETHGLTSNSDGVHGVTEKELEHILHQLRRTGGPGSK